MSCKFGSFPDTVVLISACFDMGTGDGSRWLADTTLKNRRISKHFKDFIKERLKDYYTKISVDFDLASLSKSRHATPSLRLSGHRFTGDNNFEFDPSKNLYRKKQNVGGEYLIEDDDTSFTPERYVGFLKETLSLIPGFNEE